MRDVTEEMEYSAKEENGINEKHSEWRWSPSYYTQLQSPKWQRRRLEIFQRDNWKCQECGSEVNTLHVHHMGYRGMAWEAPDGALITLCIFCHQKEEGAKKEVMTKLVNSIGVNGFMSKDIQQLVDSLNSLRFDTENVKLIVEFIRSLNHGKAIR